MDDLDAWILGNEQAAERMLVTGDADFAKETLAHLATVRKLVSDRKRWRRAWSDNGKVKKGAKLDRDLTILAEYAKRLRNRDLTNGGRSNTAIATDVGRLHKLKKSGVLKAIKRARANEVCTERRKVD
jgi:hypothetical protein